MQKQKFSYQCQSCGYESFKWQGKCNECGEWNSFVELETLKKERKRIIKTNTLPISKVEITKDERFKTNVKELDRVLGDGLTKGSLSLLSGEPGVGKSTLLLNISDQIIQNNSNFNILYISGEETISQIASRAKRLKIKTEKIHLLNENKWEKIKDEINATEYQLVILDSIQTTYSSDISGMIGSVSQIKEITFEMMNLLKSKNMTGIIIGHINKDGGVAGPKVLEHMVDTVLYFEGEKYNNSRVLRATKNRFGNTNEIGLFEMTESGLRESSYTGLRGEWNKPGRVLTCTLKGSRVIFVEIQALIKKSNTNTSRLICQGIDYNRVNTLIAIIEKYLKINLSFNDIYLSTEDSLKLNNRDSDLAIIIALLSSLKNFNISNKNIFYGEVGLDGEIKYSHFEKRKKHISQLGLTAYSPNVLKEILDVF